MVGRGNIAKSHLTRCHKPGAKTATVILRVAKTFVGVGRRHSALAGRCIAVRCAPAQLLPCAERSEAPVPIMPTGLADDEATMSAAEMTAVETIRSLTSRPGMASKPRPVEIVAQDCQRSAHSSVTKEAGSASFRSGSHRTQMLCAFCRSPHLPMSGACCRTIRSAGCQTDLAPI